MRDAFPVIARQEIPPTLAFQPATLLAISNLPAPGLLAIRFLQTDWNVFPPGEYVIRCLNRIDEVTKESSRWNSLVCPQTLTLRLDSPQEHFSVSFSSPTGIRPLPSKFRTDCVAHWFLAPLAALPPAISLDSSPVAPNTFFDNFPVGVSEIRRIVSHLEVRLTASLFSMMLRMAGRQTRNNAPSC